MSAGIRARIMKKFSKIATSIVAGCALLGITTGGAILLNDDDKDIIINVDTTPQEDPKDPEVPVEGDENTEDIPQETPAEDETPIEDEVPTEEESEESDEKISPEDTPSEEEPQETGYGYITVEAKIYNRHSGMYTKSDILNFEGKGSISVYNLYEKIKAEYPSRKEYSSPSKSLNTYLNYSEDSIIDLIVYFN